MGTASMPSLLDELQSILGRLRYVRSGDIILSEDHNTQNDALYKIKEILENHETRITGLEAGAPAHGLAEEPDFATWTLKHKIRIVSDYIPNLFVMFGMPLITFIIDDVASKVYAYAQYVSGNDILVSFLLADLESGNVLETSQENKLPITGSLLIYYILFEVGITYYFVPHYLSSITSSQTSKLTNKYVIKYSNAFRKITDTGQYYYMIMGLPSVEIYRRGTLYKTLNVLNDTGLYAFNVSISNTGKYIVMLGYPSEELPSEPEGMITEAYIIVYEGQT